jgi:hypothetical protein
MRRKFGSDRKRRRRQAEMLYEIVETVLRVQGWATLIYDGEHGLFRFPEDART